MHNPLNQEIMEILFKTKENVSDAVSVETVKASEAFADCSAYIARDKGDNKRATVVFTNPKGEIATVSTSTEMTPHVRSGAITLENLLALNVITGENGGLFFCKPSGTNAVKVSDVVAQPLTIAEYTLLAAL